MQSFSHFTTLKMSKLNKIFDKMAIFLTYQDLLQMKKNDKCPVDRGKKDKVHRTYK